MAGAESKVAQLLSSYIDTSDLSQREIAARLGYSKPNIISMFKTGDTKLPVEKVALMAEALGIDKVRLLRAVMEEYMPGTWEAIQDIMGFAVTENEREIIDTIRSATDDTDPKLNPTAKSELIEWAKALV